MSFDLRRCSKADLDALNERARDWKAPQSKQSDQPQETPLVICNISDRCPRGNHAKPRIEGSEFAQERLQGRITQPSFLWTRRILERLQAIQNQ